MTSMVIGVDPLVTIIVTSRNYAKMVGDAIRSALDQTYPNIEVLVLDNASTDESMEVIGAFTDPRVRVIARPENIGMRANHNDGIVQARGDFIVFLSADDMLLPHLVRDAMTYRRENPDVDIVYGSAIILDGDSNFEYYFDHPNFDAAESYSLRNELASLLTRDNCMYLPTIVFPKSTFAELGAFDETLEIVLDYEYCIRMAAAEKRFAFTARPGCLIRFHGENRSGLKNFVSTGDQLREFCTILERYTQPQYRQRLAGWRSELNRMVETKISEFGAHFPAEFEAKKSEVLPYIERARASINEIPAIGDDVLAASGLISVIVPFTGRGDLQRALRSLQEQDYDNWEAIVVADSTYDPTGLIAWMELVGKVRVSRLRSRHGPVAARNLGIGGANGEIICYLDEDNRFAPGYLRAVATALANPNMHVVAARSRLIVTSTTGAVLTSHDMQTRLSSDGQISRVSNQLPLNAVAHRRACFAETGSFNAAMTLLEDWEFLLRLNSVFRFEPIDAEVQIGVGAILWPHYLFGRQNSVAWNEFATRLQEIYTAIPAQTPAELEARKTFADSLQTTIQAGVNSGGNPDAVADFVLRLTGSAGAVGAAHA